MLKRLLGIAAIVWTLLITVLCLTSGDAFSSLATFKIPHKDKYVHFFFYFVFTFLWYAYSVKHIKVSRKKARMIIFITALSYGIVIEILQELIAHKRSADVMDALANTLGSITAILIVWLFEKNKK